MNRAWRCGGQTQLLTCEDRGAWNMVYSYITFFNLHFWRRYCKCVNNISPVYGLVIWRNASWVSVHRSLPSKWSNWVTSKSWSEYSFIVHSSQVLTFSEFQPIGSRRKRSSERTKWHYKNVVCASLLFLLVLRFIGQVRKIIAGPFSFSLYHCYGWRSESTFFSLSWLWLLQRRGTVGILAISIYAWILGLCQPKW